MLHLRVRRAAITHCLGIVLGTTCLLNAPLPSASAQDAEIPKIVMDTSQLDVLNAFAKKAEATAKDWYPRIVKILGVTNPKPRGTITLVMDFDYKGVAATSGEGIHISTEYARKHPDDLGMVVHELTHVVQAYPKYDPVWLVEGIADYVRFYHFEPVAKRPHPDPAKVSARDSYRTTAAFLDWTTTKYNKELVRQLDHVLKESTYKEETFKELTGKSLDDLNTEWIASLRATAAK
jgi:hypothetical protein